MAIKIKGQVVIDDNQNIISSGEATATNFKTGTTNVHDSGIEVSGINVLGGDTPIGSEATIYDTGNASFVNVNATTYYGDGSNLTGLFSGVYADLTGKPSIPTHTSSLTNDSGYITDASGLFNISANGGLQMGSAGTANGVTLSMIAGTSPAASAYTLLQGYQSNGTTQAFGFKADGSAEFAGGNFEIDSSGVIQTNINTAGIVKLNSTADFTNPKIELNSVDGSASFAGGNLTITSAGRLDTSEINSIGTSGFYAKSPSDSGYGLRVVDSSNTHVFDVNFQGNVMAKRSVSLTNGYGAGTDGNAALFTRNAANDTTTSTINYDGSASFAGTIDAAGFTVNGSPISSGGSDASTLSGMAPSTDSTGDTIAQRHNNGSLSMTYTYTSWVQARTDINTAFDPAAFVVMQDGWYYHLNKADMKSALDVGFIPQNYVDSAYTLTADDKGKHIKSAGQNVTVPSGVFSTGDVITIYNFSYGSITLTQGSGVTIYQAGTGSTGNRSLANFALATILCTHASTNEFVVSGTGVS